MFHLRIFKACWRWFHTLDTPCMWFLDSWKFNTEVTLAWFPSSWSCFTCVWWSSETKLKYVLLQSLFCYHSSLLCYIIFICFIYLFYLFIFLFISVMCVNLYIAVMNLQSSSCHFAKKKIRSFLEILWLVE